MHEKNEVPAAAIMSGAIPSLLEFFLLGPPSIYLNHCCLPISRRKTKALLFALASRPAPLGRSAAAGLLWPESPPDSARQSLRQALYDASACAGISLFSKDGRFLGFAEGLEIVTDVARFTAFAEQGLAEAKDSPGKMGRPADPEAALSQAELLYRGEFLEGFYLDDASSFEDWQLEEAQRLSSLAASVETSLARLALEEGKAQEAEAKARRAIEVSPSSELGHCLLVEALAASGEPEAALGHAGEYRKMVLSERGHEPGQAFLALMAQIEEGRRKAADPGIKADPPAQVRKLPCSMTSFVGREREVETLAGLIKPGSIVNLVGPGGIGKTRLALEAGARAAGDFVEGAVLADLVPCARDSDVSTVVATALGLRLGRAGTASLPIYLSSRGLLLILDNCEHVLAGAAETAARIAQGCPGIAVLATSRERLGVPGEILMEVPPLGMPTDLGEGIEARAALGAEAPRLLLERSQAVAPGWIPRPEDAGDIVAICARLDALPLALELAAVRLASLGPSTLRSLLESRLSAPVDLLDRGFRSPRAAHRALGALFDWSWETLDGKESRTFARLSVFRGSFSLEAAVAVCGEGSEKSILSLVEKRLASSSFGSPKGAGLVRFRLLETIKSYAALKLEEAGGVQDARRAHVAWYSAQAARQEEGLRVLSSIDALEAAKPDIDEFEAALRYAIDLPGLIPVAAGMARSLVDLFKLSGVMNRLGEAIRGIEPRLGELGEGPAADLQYAMGHFHMWREDIDSAYREFDAAAELYRRAGDRLMEAYALSRVEEGSGVESFVAGDPSASRPRRALEIFKSLGSVHGLAGAYLSLAWGSIFSGNSVPDGKTALDQGLPYARECGSLPLLARYWICYAYAAARRSDRGSFLSYLDLADRISLELDDPENLALSYEFRYLEERDHGQAEAVLGLARKYLEYERKRGDPLTISRAMNNEVVGLFILGKRDEALARGEEALEFALTTGNTEQINLHRIMIAYQELGRGNMRRAFDIAEQMVGEARRQPESILLPRSLMRLARMYSIIDEGDKAIELFRQVEAHPAASYLARISRINLCYLEPDGPFAPAAAAAGELRSWVASQDDESRRAVIGIGLRLIGEGHTELGLSMAARSLAIRSLDKTMIANLYDRTRDARIQEGLRRRLGDEKVEEEFGAARERYLVDYGLYFREIEALLPQVEAAFAAIAEGKASPSQARVLAEGRPKKPGREARIPRVRAKSSWDSQGPRG